MGSNPFIPPFYPYTLFLASTLDGGCLASHCHPKGVLDNQANNRCVAFNACPDGPFTTKRVTFYGKSALLHALAPRCPRGGHKIPAFRKIQVCLLFFSSPLYIESIHGASIYLIFSRIFVALVYTLRNGLLDRFRFRFSPPSSFKSYMLSSSHPRKMPNQPPSAPLFPTESIHSVYGRT